MFPHDLPPPENLPVLSRGKHRSPRKGACFMELVSYLAGEPWSDHPACTHPLLAAVARHVNDYTSDEARPRLALLIPSVIGLTSDEPHVDARVALRCARAALPVAAAERQRVMAVAVLACERMLDDFDGRPSGSMEEASRSALEQVPHAAQWAYRFTRNQQTSSAGFRRHAAPSIVANAVGGIARACVPDPDQLLRELLIEAINECRAWVDHGPDHPATVDTAKWSDACGLSGSAAAPADPHRLTIQAQKRDPRADVAAACSGRRSTAQGVRRAVPRRDGCPPPR